LTKEKGVEEKWRERENILAGKAGLEKPKEKRHE
jgi:hypothetical protein